MLHTFGSTLFLLAIAFYFFKYFTFISKKLCLKLHIIIGSLATLYMILYSILNFIKFREISILPIAISSFLIIISGLDKFKKRFNRLHIISVFIFVVSLINYIFK